MRPNQLLQTFCVFWAILTVCAVNAGCHTCCHGCNGCCCPPGADFPRELNKVSLPPYVIEPPDILQIDVLTLVPVPPYRIAPLDAILVQATQLLETMPPITGVYTVEPEGTVNLGLDFGVVPVAGLTLKEATAVIQARLRSRAKDAVAIVSLAQMRAMQQVRGEHLVGQDGTINLGNYGQVRVVGLTVDQARAVIEQQLSRFFVKPEISLVVTGYNSKVYYVVFDGAGYGQQLYRQPITGNETVLDAIADIRGLPAQASLHRVWVVRPAPPGAPCDQVLPVDWPAVVACGRTATNYQLLPGDRLHVEADCLIHTSNFLTKLIQPFEQVFGITLLGDATIREVAQPLRGAASTGGTGLAF